MSISKLSRRKHDWPDRAPAPGYEVEAPASLDELDFRPQPMVGWYSPKELFVAGFRAVVSAIFGSYADKREIESLLAEGEWHDYSEYFKRHGEIWIDYVADLGDGWHPTYTIARLLALDRLAFADDGTGVETVDDASVVTERGRILVMGGDQVYPTASLDEYRNRLTGPYRCALPFVGEEDHAPHLFTVPGNHDWYDGLTSFFQLFCHHRWIGGWKTQQNRSYFALKIDERLWLWGIDIQLSANIDQPQLDYFETIASEMPANSNIILCTAEPSWAYVEMNTWQERNRARRERQKELEYKNLGHLQSSVTQKYGHRIAVALAGDAHTYARYESDDGGAQRIVSGGGGASQFPSHDMPEALELPEKYGGERYRRRGLFPDEKTSRRLANLSVLFPFFRLNWSFSAFMGAFYLLLAWVIQSVSKISAAEETTLLDNLAASFDVAAFVRVLAHSPGSVTFLVVLLFGFIAFSGFKSAPKKILHGVAHTLAHVALFLCLLYAFAQINLGLVGLDVDEWRQVLLFGVEMLTFGGFLGGFVFGVYLWFSNRFLRLHEDEILLCQSDPDYKHFLRLKVSKDGTIAVYPVGVPKVAGETGWALDPVARAVAGWSLQTDASGGTAWFEPADGPIQPRARLIEEPITVAQDAQPSGKVE